MSNAACFIEPFGLCISQANAVSGAFLTALASLLGTVWKIYADRGIANKRQTFEASEREKRQAFEEAERKARETFEQGQSTASDNTQERIKKNLESYIKLEKWREESWQRVLARLEKASQELQKTTSGLTTLIDEGPHFDDLRMIKETAKVLDVFGDFQTLVGHFSLPESIADASAEIVNHVTRVLLTLSPLQQVRQSDERRALLSPLRTDLVSLTSSFMKICREFERNPSTFIPRPNAA